MTTRPPSIGRIFAGYMGVRLLLFGCALVICVVLGLSGFVSVLVALIVSGLVAYPLAKRQRDDIAKALQERRGR